MFWLGERLNRLERWPRRYYGAVFVLTWLCMTMLAHFGGLDSGGSRVHYGSWASAVGIGFLLAVVASAVVLIGRR